MPRLALVFVLLGALVAAQSATETKSGTDTKAASRPTTRPAEARVQHPKIGVRCDPIALEQSGIARVESIVPGSPAEKAGLKVGDIILTVGGETIKDDKSYRESMARRKVGGEPVPFHVRRGAEELDLEVVLSEARRAEPDTVTVQHCLIAFAGAQMSQSPRTQVEAKLLAEDILKKIKSGADFSELVAKYTEDPGSKNNIPPGSYTLSNDGKSAPGAMARSQMAGAWAAVAFSLEVGDAALVPYDKDLAPHGFYVIKRLS